MIINQTADRLFLGLLTLSLVLFAALKPETSAFWTSRNDPVGQASLFVLGVLSLVVLADVVINDLMPDRFRFKTGVKTRQTIWMWIGVTYLAYAFVNVRVGFEWWLAVVYALCAMRSAVIALIDLQQSVNSMRRDRRKTDPKAEVKGVP